MKSTPYQLIHLAKSKLRSIPAGAPKFDTVVEAQRALIVAIARNPSLNEEAVALVQDAFGMLLQASFLAMACEQDSAIGTSQLYRTVNLVTSALTNILDYIEGKPQDSQVPTVVADVNKPTLEID